MKKDKHPAEEPMEQTLPVEEAGEAPAAEEPQPDFRVAELEEKLVATEKQRDEYLDLAQRSRAEFENFRRRNAAVREDSLEEGNRKALKALLPVLDNMQRTLDAMQGLEESYRSGAELVLRQMKEITASLGLEEIAALGQPFNPDFHDAVMQAPATEEYASGTVMMVLQTGYTVKGRVIRPAMVQVAQ